MKIPFPVYVFGALDLAALVVTIGLFGCLVWFAGSPFSWVGGAFCLIVGGHFAVMLRGLWRPTATGYYDHLFSYVLILLLLSQWSFLMVGPVLVAFVFGCLKPGIRAYFGLTPRDSWLLRRPTAVITYLGILGIALTAFQMWGTFPLMGTSFGLLAPLKNPVLAWVFLGTATILALASLVGWSPAFVLAPLWALYPLLCFVPGSLFPAAVLLAAWASPGNREHFGFDPGHRKLVVIPLGFLALFVGVAQAWLPIGTCPRHQVSTFLYPAWESPLLKQLHANDVAFRPTRPVASMLVRCNCTVCERAVIFRNERAICRQSLREVAQRVQEVLVASPGIDLRTRSEPVLTLASEGPTLGSDLEAFSASLASDGPTGLTFPCPYQRAMLASGTVRPGRAVYRFRYDHDLETLTGFCDYCETNGL